MKQRKLVIGLLVMLAVVVSGFTYAFWAGTITDGTGSAAGSVQIGEGEPVTIAVSVGAQDGSTLDLVPAGFIEDTEAQDDEIIVTFAVTWTDDDALAGIADADLLASVTNIEVGGVANPYTLISVVPSGLNASTIGLGNTVVLSFVVTMGEPADQTEYTAVAGKEITFDLTFSVNQ